MQDIFILFILLDGLCQHNTIFHECLGREYQQFFQWNPSDLLK